MTAFPATTSAGSNRSDLDRRSADIDALARETQADATLVKELYDRELAHLETKAKVRNFIFVLARRNVRATLLRPSSVTRLHR